MRELFDAGLVDVLPISRLALAPTGAPNNAELLYGSAPNLYIPTAMGLEILSQAGVIDKDRVKRASPAYGPKNSLFLAHELMVRDVRVWLEESSQSTGGEQGILSWKDGAEAAIELGEGVSNRQPRPDAWFVYQLQPDPYKKVLVGLVEVDRGTERGDRHWREKLEAYAALFSSGLLGATTGYQNARILIITPNARRRDQLSEFIAGAGALSSRFWLAEQTVLAAPGLTLPAWRTSQGSRLQPLIPA